MRRLLVVPGAAASRSARFSRALPLPVTRNYATFAAKKLRRLPTSFFDDIRRDGDASKSTVIAARSSPSHPTFPSHLLEISHYAQAHTLLAYLSKDPELLTSRSFQDIALPSLITLLRIHHYAGARELLEALFERGFSSPDISSNSLNQLLSCIFAQDFSGDMSVAATDALLRYILDQISAGHFEQAVNFDTILLLTLHPRYISIPNIRKVVALLGYPQIKSASLDDVGRKSQMLHGVMSVYSMHGETEMAELWMKAIIQTEKELQDTKQESAARNNAQEKGTCDSSFGSLPSKHSHDRQSDRLGRPSTAMQLGTTYISTFGRSSFHFPKDLEVEEAVDEVGLSSHSSIRTIDPSVVDSSTAMTFFDTLRGTGPMAAQHLDIYTWTAILNVAGRDHTRVTTQSLLEVFGRLKSDSSLPNPNIVTYTALLSALTARGEALRAAKIFEAEILPLVLENKLELDAMALQEYMNACMYSDSIERCGDVMRWFGKKADPEQAVQAESSEVIEGGKPWDILQSIVQLDVQIINNYLTILAKNGMFACLFSLYSEMESTFSVVPDEITLSILAKAAISHGARRGGGGVPTRAEDAYLPFEGRRSLRRSGPSQVDEMQLWNGEQPFIYVRRIFWAMLEDNYPLISSRARDAMLSPTRRLLLGSSPSSTSTTAQTNALSSPTYHAKPLAYPHLSPSNGNMHLFIALLGYFSASHEIPLVLAYMKELYMVPSRRTLCLALWSFEEGGSYAKERRALQAWLVKWLGQERVPQDGEIAMFRRKQWGM